MTRSSPQSCFATTKGKLCPHHGWKGCVIRICRAARGSVAFDGLGQARGGGGGRGRPQPPPHRPAGLRQDDARAPPAVHPAGARAGGGDRGDGHPQLRLRGKRRRTQPNSPNKCEVACSLHRTPNSGEFGRVGISAVSNGAGRSASPNSWARSSGCGAWERRLSDLPRMG